LKVVFSHPFAKGAKGWGTRHPALFKSFGADGAFAWTASPKFANLLHRIRHNADWGIILPRIHFHQQLAELKDKLLAMAALSQQALDSAVDAYLQRDPIVCQYVRENETAINAAQREVDEMAYELLAKEQPMAIDLRFILAVIKINGDLERIGDQAMSIAIRTQDLMSVEPANLPVDIGSMGDYASRMIRTSVQSLLDGDAQVAEMVRDMDDEIDRMNRVAQRDLTRVIQEHPERTQQALHAILVSRNLERIADHATNIATDVIFWIRGADLRHQLSAAVD
jgi:phosphate transport system protein